MREFADKMQVSLKKNSSDLFTFLLKIVSGSLLGLTFALIVQEIMGKKDGDALLSFVFMILVIMAVFLRISKKWNLPAVLIFDLVCVLVGMVLRLYIMVAPGA